MAVAVTLRGFEALGQSLLDFQKQAERAQLRAVTKATLLVETEIRERQIQKGGFRKIRQLRTWRVAQPKAKDGVVRTRTGALRSSINSRVEQTKAGVIGTVGSPLDYALWLERGTKKGTQKPHAIPGALVGNRRPWITVRVRGAIKARNFMQKGLEAVGDKIDQLMAEELAIAIRSAGLEPGVA